MSTQAIHPDNAFCHTIDDLHLGEFDIGGVLYHANYFHLFEQAREALYRHTNIPYSDFVNAGSYLAITESHLHYLAPIPFGVELEVYLWVENMKHASLEFHYEVFRRDLSPVGVLHRASTKHAFVESKGGVFQVAAVPEEIRAALEAYLV